MNHRICLALAVLALAIAFAAPAQAAQVSIDGLTFGQVVNAKVDKKDLTGKVVLVKYWGTNCGPCVAEMPETESFYHEMKELAADGFELVAMEVQGHGAGELQSFINERNLTFPIACGGSVTGVEVKGIPHVVVFDHTGALVYNGKLGGAKQVVKDAIAISPTCIVGALDQYKHCGKEAKQILSGKKLGETLASLRAMCEGDQASAADAAAEAGRLVNGLDRYGKVMLERAAKLCDSESVVVAAASYKDIAADFKGDTLGEQAQARYDEITGADNWKTENQAWKMYMQLQATYEKYEKAMNKRIQGQIESGAAQLEAACPGTGGARKAAALAGQVKAMLSAGTTGCGTCGAAACPGC